MSRFIAPSMLSCDFGKLSREVDMVNRSQADYIHLDIMDGVFVPNISFGFPVVSAIARESKKPLDAHLMIIEPDRYIENFSRMGISCLSIHYEASLHLHRSLQKIKSYGMKAGIALNPHTPASSLNDIIQEADFILVMSVNPGFGGQNFIENSYRKISRIKEIINNQNPGCMIEVDGGVTRENAPLLYDAGADILVAGNSVFGSEDPLKAIKQIKGV
ncbi:MAG: ribulose-phosphate 3-epimerase [Bacteroidales bacterium]|nr:ribulose-phosphate 3-epimerase [Bacteroidales bacterium]MDD2424754.1 ribulose-phosphate 3-epimerase [Bacteroidales bacterium]MDD3988678.1 ribulose-phosphate 3-epimerase [Bacteroidales bacterium]MDD4638537.1 ribulose-phosphate 3-epimerase [Bacteroidales bacterium]